MQTNPTVNYENEAQTIFSTNNDYIVILTELEKINLLQNPNPPQNSVNPQNHSPQLYMPRAVYFHPFISVKYTDQIVLKS